MSAGYVYILGAPLPVKGAFKCHYTYRRGLLRCSFRLDWAMRRPCGEGLVTGTDSRAFSLYGNRLSKFRTQVKNTLIGVPVDDIIETSNHFGS